MRDAAIPMPKGLLSILVVSSLALLALMVGAVYSFVVFVEGLTASAALNGQSVRIALSCAFVIGAILLYAVKNSRAQFAYGLAEVAVGLVANGSLSTTGFIRGQVRN